LALDWARQLLAIREPEDQKQQFFLEHGYPLRRNLEMAGQYNYVSREILDSDGQAFKALIDAALQESL
jgi:hypothetical protein